MANELSPTSYAILGLLAVKPWTTYELAQQMQRALGHFWPRAQSKLYEEPKKLVVLGLAKATPEKVGQRPRTVYSITAKGRRALAAWQPDGDGGPVLEFEELIKVFFAEHGTKRQLLESIERVRAWSEDRIESTSGIAPGYLEGEGPFPERLPWLALCGVFLDEFNYMVGRWAQWAAQTVADWPDDVRLAEPDRATLGKIARRTEEYLQQPAGQRRLPAAMTFEH